MFCSIPQCLEYTFGRFGDNLIIDESIKTQIQHAKSSINITQKNKESIIELINNLKDKNNNPIYVFINMKIE